MLKRGTFYFAESGTFHFGLTLKNGHLEKIQSVHQSVFMRFICRLEELIYLNLLERQHFGAP
jgi:hypothetical protein